MSFAYCNHNNPSATLIPNILARVIRVANDERLVFD